jgi:hypothetical protein
MHAEITAYKGRIIIELKVKKSIPGEVLTSLDTPRLPGQLVNNTAKNLGISKEALDLLKSVRKGDGAAGDVDWTRTEEGKTTFGWIGGRCAIFNPETCEGSKRFKVGGYVTIPNEVPEGARQQLDKHSKLPALRKGLLAQTEL